MNMNTKRIILANSLKPPDREKFIKAIIAKTEAANMCMMQTIRYIFHLIGMV